MNVSSLKAFLIGSRDDDLDLRALVQLSQFNLGYMPWTTSSMRPAGLRLVVNDVLMHKRQSGLEFGAGVSTVFLAKAFQRSRGMLTTVDHDGSWLESIAVELNRFGIVDDVCRVGQGPL